MKFLNTDYRLLIAVLLWAAPLHSQSFNTLLDELVGSEADQLESQIADLHQDESPLAPLSSTDIVHPPEEDEFSPEKNIVTNGVTLQGLDKQTARVFIIDAPIGQPIEFGALKIIVRHCEKTPLEDRQDSMAFLTISEEKPTHASQDIFSGWMFASSPALSALDHPIYDVWVKGCKNLVH